MSSVFNQKDVQELLNRIDTLQPESKAVWGKMTAAQMLAHCCVAYEMHYENIHKKPNFFLRYMLKTFVKPGVVNDIPYPKNGRTAPAFLITNDRDFAKEKARLKQYLQRTLEVGASGFHGQVSLSFGPLTSKEWNNLFYKHLDHHLQQFGA